MYAICKEINANIKQSLSISFKIKWQKHMQWTSRVGYINCNMGYCSTSRLGYIQRTYIVGYVNINTWSTRHQHSAMSRRSLNGWSCFKGYISTELGVCWESFPMITNTGLSYLQVLQMVNRQGIGQNLVTTINQHWPFLSIIHHQFMIGKLIRHFWLVRTHDQTSVFDQ